MMTDSEPSDSCLHEDGSAVSLVLAIPDLVDKIISHCDFSPLGSHVTAGTAELFKLRLISHAFNEAVLTSKKLPCERALRRLNVCGIKHRPFIESESWTCGIPRRLEKEELALLDPRLCRVLKAGCGSFACRLKTPPPYDYFGTEMKKHNALRNHDKDTERRIHAENLIDICTSHGEWIRELTAEGLGTPSKQLIPFIKAIDNHCPNLECLEVLLLCCPIPHEDDDDDENDDFPFQTKPALTKLSITFLADNYNDSASCSHTQAIASAFFKSAPNLRSLSVESPNFIGDLTVCHAITNLELRLNDPLSKPQLKSLSVAISACSETLETLTVTYELEEAEEEEDDDNDYTPFLLPSFLNLRTLDLDTTGDVVDSFARPLLTTILEGKAPLLRELLFVVPDANDTVSHCFSALEPESVATTVVENLELSQFTHVWEILPHMANLHRTFPNLKQITIEAVLFLPPVNLYHVDPNLLAVFRELRRWEQLKEVKLMVAATFSICQLYQVFGYLGERFFRSWALETLKFGSNAGVVPFNNEAHMTELGRLFGNEYLEQFKLMLMWTGHMKKVEFYKIVMPPSASMMDRLTPFIQENHLPVEFKTSSLPVLGRLENMGLSFCK